MEPVPWSPMGGPLLEAESSAGVLLAPVAPKMAKACLWRRGVLRRGQRAQLLLLPRPGWEGALLGRGWEVVAVDPQRGAPAAVWWEAPG